MQKILSFSNQQKEEEEKIVPFVFEDNNRIFNEISQSIDENFAEKIKEKIQIEKKEANNVKKLEEDLKIEVLAPLMDIPKEKTEPVKELPLDLLKDSLPVLEEQVLP